MGTWHCTPVSYHRFELHEPGIGILLLLHAGLSSGSWASTTTHWRWQSSHTTSRKTAHHAHPDFSPAIVSATGRLIPLTVAQYRHSYRSQHTVASRFLVLLNVYEQRGNATSCSSTATALITAPSMCVCVWRGVVWGGVGCVCVSVYAYLCAMPNGADNTRV